ncbi:lactate utilization protein B [Deinococcus pimensis]|uniref:lactate utilization protein B n=1 Tax=Deinococcus pimensis TaxID=309888 RepID=UPI000488FF5D|nr:lactate utilization protein B [Deinococcus pimensis]
MSAGGIRPARTFQKAAKVTLANAQMRRNLRHATTTIREKRLRAVAELPDWEALRGEGADLKDFAMANLGDLLLDLEAAVTSRGGQVHWARDAEEAREIVARIATSHGAREVIKVKSISTDEIELNAALERHGVHAVETDLAELIVQLAEDRPSHILVPAIHRNRAEIRDLFRRRLGAELLTDDPKALAEAARVYLRGKFLTTKVAVSGANFAVAESGTVCVVESEGNGRMCVTMPDVLVTVMGIEKVLPTWQDVAVFLRLLPRSSTAERMNPYTSFWSGVREGDGPREFHLVLLDGGRTEVLADEVGRQTLRCIRCSACLNVCPVYERAGGHAYGSVYPGPIGAILTPQLLHLEDANANTLPWASSLCGACYDACPVRIDIPEVLLYLRGRINEEKPLNAEAVAFRSAAWVMSEPHRFEGAIKLARTGQGPLVRDGAIHALPGLLGGWTDSRDLPAFPRQSFREWWRTRPAPTERPDDGNAGLGEGELLAPEREDTR